MIRFCCAICGKVFSGNKNVRFCSPDCRLAGRKLRRNKYTRASASKRAVEKVCAFCGCNFVTMNNCKVYCSEGCRFDSDAARRLDAPKIKREIPKSNCCICGVEFDLFYSKTVTCRDKNCIKVHALDMKHKRIANGAPKTRDKQQVKDLNPEYQVVDAICPGCGVVHKYRFEPAWIGNGVPRIKCTKYPSCMSQTIGGLLSVRRQYQDSFETNNRAMI
jgi:hypothetical protein